MIDKTYGDITAYSNSQLEEDATLLVPFASKCSSLKHVYVTDGVRNRSRTEQVSDAALFRQNVANRFYLTVRAPIRAKMRWPFVKRYTRRLTVAHQITIADKQYIQLHLS